MAVHTLIRGQKSIANSRHAWRNGWRFAKTIPDRNTASTTGLLRDAVGSREFESTCDQLASHRIVWERYEQRGQSRIYWEDYTPGSSAEEEILMQTKHPFLLPCRPNASFPYHKVRRKVFHFLKAPSSVMPIIPAPSRPIQSRAFESSATGWHSAP